MKEVGIASLVLIITNVFCTLRGLNDHFSFKRNNFETGRILLQKEYRRLITAGFFHVSRMHLILNMVTLCFFVAGMGQYLGEARCLFIYFASLAGGNLFALFIYRKEEAYSSAVGASGGVSGAVFAAIALVPGFHIGFLGTNFHLNSWFCGLLYFLLSIYTVRSKKENIGYETQLAGGLTGLVIAIIMRPSALENNYPTILAFGGTTALFIYFIITNPRILLIDNRFFNEQHLRYTIENILDQDRDHEQEINIILEKIYQNGIGSLSKTDKEKLDHYSRIMQ